MACSVASGAKPNPCSLILEQCTDACTFPHLLLTVCSVQFASFWEDYVIAEAFLPAHAKTLNWCHARCIEWSARSLHGQRRQSYFQSFRFFHGTAGLDSLDLNMYVHENVAGTCVAAWKKRLRRQPLTWWKRSRLWRGALHISFLVALTLRRANNLLYQSEVLQRLFMSFTCVPCHKRTLNTYLLCFCSEVTF